MTRARPSPARRAFTLTELVVSMGVMSVLVVALGSIIALATRALPDDDSATALALAGDRALADLRNDLAYATRLTEWGPGGVTLVAADRDGDGAAERIRYAWAGGAGDPLTRAINSGAAATLVEPVDGFAFTPNVRKDVETYTGVLVEGASTTVFSQMDLTSTSVLKIKSDRWAAQVFRPDGLGPNDRWSFSGFSFAVSRSGTASGTLKIEVRTAGDDLVPTNEVLGTALIPEYYLPSYLIRVNLSMGTPITDIPGDESLCIVWSTDSTDGEVAEVQYTDRGVNLSGSAWVEGDPAWKTPQTDKAATMTASGTISQPGADQTLTRCNATDANVQLFTADGRGGRSLDRSTDLRLANQPWVVDAAWELDFSTDPTAGDADGDGAGDWQMDDGNPFKVAALSNGVWTVDRQMNSSPNHDFTRPTVVEVTCRAATTGTGPVVRINADYSGGTFAPIWFSVDRLADNTQTVSLYAKPSSGSDKLLQEVDGLGGGMITVRLIIDPDIDSVHMETDGTDRGTYAYSTYTPSARESGERFVSIATGGATAEVDWVRVRAYGAAP